MPQSLTYAEINGRLDTLGPQRVDRRPQQTNLAIAHGSGSATDPRSRHGWDPERKTDPCPPYPPPAPGSAPSDATGHRNAADRAGPPQQPGSANTLGRR
ncbi:hypothetical protein E0H26_28860 [Micromonospora zingiberis]|uniref:Uncharacterized protein n=1 Tax=Micromonospora zingiberis TaxID=2053011 RepID=A0A4R0FW31_9ACTN|nr:hypothetical protein E0H26_28860 [Micromonospora zingiberis]